MWIEAVAPERIAELFENYQSALGVLGPKGSECGSSKEPPQPGNNADDEIPRAFCSTR